MRAGVEGRIHGGGVEEEEEEWWDRSEVETGEGRGFGGSWPRVCRQNSLVGFGP